jgi:PAS domain S-box-containing protein
VPIEIGLNSIEVADGLFMLASIIDITERKRAHAAHERLAAIVESSDDAIISKTPDGVVTSWNRGAELLFGYTAQEAIGQAAMVLVPAHLQDEELHAAAQILRNEPVNRFETLRLRRDSSEDKYIH